MQIHVRLYSVARHRDGKIIDRLSLDLPSGSRVGDAVAALAIHPDLEPVLSLNETLAEETDMLSEGDELAIIPSVAGG